MVARVRESLKEDAAVEPTAQGGDGPTKPNHQTQPIQNGKSSPAKGNGNGVKGNGAKGNGAKGNGAKGNGAKGNGAKGNGAKGNGAKGNGAKGNGAKTPPARDPNTENSSAGSAKPAENLGSPDEALIKLQPLLDGISAIPRLRHRRDAAGFLVHLDKVGQENAAFKWVFHTSPSGDVQRLVSETVGAKLRRKSKGAFMFPAHIPVLANEFYTSLRQLIYPVHLGTPNSSGSVVLRPRYKEETMADYLVHAQYWASRFASGPADNRLTTIFASLLWYNHQDNYAVEVEELRVLWGTDAKKFKTTDDVISWFRNQDRLRDAASGEEKSASTENSDNTDKPQAAPQAAPKGKANTTSKRKGGYAPKPTFRGLENLYAATSADKLGRDDVPWIYSTAATTCVTNKYSHLQRPRKIETRKIKGMMSGQEYHITHKGFGVFTFPAFDGSGSLSLTFPVYYAPDYPCSEFSAYYFVGHGLVLILEPQNNRRNGYGTGWRALFKDRPSVQYRVTSSSELFEDNELDPLYLNRFKVDKSGTSLEEDLGPEHIVLSNEPNTVYDNPDTANGEAIDHPMTLGRMTLPNDLRKDADSDDDSDDSILDHLQEGDYLLY